jgi:hypothetical protein
VLEAVAVDEKDKLGEIVPDDEVDVAEEAASADCELPIGGTTAFEVAPPAEEVVPEDDVPPRPEEGSAGESC